MGLNRPMRLKQKWRALEMAFKARLPLVLKLKYSPIAWGRRSGMNIHYSIIDEMHSYRFGGANDGKEADEPL